jgi:hypothetical protein
MRLEDFLCLKMEDIKEVMAIIHKEEEVMEANIQDNIIKCIIILDMECKIMAIKWEDNLMDHMEIQIKVIKMLHKIEEKQKYLLP